MGKTPPVADASVPTMRLLCRGRSHAARIDPGPPVGDRGQLAIPDADEAAVTHAPIIGPVAARIERRAVNVQLAPGLHRLGVVPLLAVPQPRPGAAAKLPAFEVG